MQLQLGATPGTLLDGFSSWNASAEDAFMVWNSNLANLRFAVVRDSTAPRAEGNRINNVLFNTDVYGDAWGANVLAVTLTWSSGTNTTETDVLFNSLLAWNSYRGGLRTTGTGAAMYDFHRVALHEFGHVLGLDHPDQFGQTVTAIMNSRITSLDALAADDISGAQSIYGIAAGAVAPPTITSQPISRSVTAGQAAAFTVTASGSAPLTYQWLKNSAGIANATSATLSFASAALTDAGIYTVNVTNNADSVTSSPATLTVTAPVAPTPPVTTTPPAPTTPTGPVVTAPAAVAPTITTQPRAQVAHAGATASFSVVASGTAPLSYQWRKNNVPLTGAVNATLTLTGLQSADAGTYTVFVSNAAGSVTSAGAALTVNLPPGISAPPADQTVLLGGRASFSVAATGTGPLSYQWRKNSTDLPNATNATLTLDPAKLSDAGGYSVVVTNAVSSAASASAQLTVIGPPTIAAAPQPQTISNGDRVVLTVTATSGVTASYQWLKDGIEIPGATGATLSIDAARPTDNAAYAVRITNAAGSITSPTAALTVKFSRLTNLSTRGFVPAGGALTPGFYIRGGEPKSLLVRGVGPTLSLFGVGTALGATNLEVVAQESAAVVASNTAWSGTPTLTTVFAKVGAFPLAADSKDAAVQASLPPRSYTVRITPGDAAMSGITLAEIYDVDTLVGSASQLVNLSTLGFVGSGDNALTAGFAISGNAPKRLLIRAIGPGLAPFGVANALPDPQLGLVPLGGSEPIATNDDWPDLVNVRAAFSAAGAFTLPAGSKDAALVITLEPGAYTVVVSGVNGSATGNALVEIYDLDP